MIGRVILAALLAGIAAGIVMGVIQHVRLTPMILEAEVYERATHAHDHGSAAPDAAGAEQPAADHDHDHGEEGWTPADGWQRTLLTTFNSAMAGAGFAALLAGLSLVLNLPITRANGLAWGLCGFLAVTLAPAVGLPPELPGMPGADLLSRQIWWVSTIAATAAGIYLLATQRAIWTVLLALALILAPQVIGAPAAVHEESLVPPALAAAFAANSIAANAIFWCVIGLFLGLALDRTAKDIHAT